MLYDAAVIASGLAVLVVFAIIAHVMSDREARDAIAARADRQHGAALRGELYGLYGDYLPPTMFRHGR